MQLTLFFPEENNNGKKNGNSANLGFEEKLWVIADKLRGRMDAAQYKHVVLSLIFLKYISDVFEKSFQILQNIQGIDPEDCNNYIVKKMFWVPKEARWSYLQANLGKSVTGELISKAMLELEKANPFLQNVLTQDRGWLQLDSPRLDEMMDLISTLGLGNDENHGKDIIGRVYEYFLGKFARSEGSNGGEFYTPQSVVQLLVEMIEPYKGRIYDPCCGSGGMFVQSEKFIRTHGGQMDGISIYGQESNLTTWRLCKMNLAVRGIDGDLGSKPADTFQEDLHPNLKADFIIANPPFNISDWGGQKLRRDIRWRYGVPPLNNANFAWVQHIIHHLAPSGLAGFVLSNGSLSTNQGREEGVIRKAIIEADLIDCIIALPTQLFYNTQIAACLWFLANDKSEAKLRNRRGQTLFIYAQELGHLVDRTHRELSDFEISLMVKTYHSWRSKESSAEYKDIPGFCKSVSIEEIRQHKMALVPGRYVGFDDSLTKHWDDSRLRAELTQVESRLTEINEASEAAISVLRRVIYG
ncbi:MAG: class I SAM-dependent DNA methyltransferase [Chloroflexota bacterium]|nr:type I restriction-modification system subunit M [Chloroflexota bacterium]